jgi:hypothetical protein
VRLSRQLPLPIAAATVALAVLLAVRPLSTSRALAIWTLIVAALALAVLVRHARGGRRAQHASRFESALAGQPAKASQPVELLRMERELVLGTANATHAHLRLLPLLRAAAAARLASHHGIELEQRRQAAQALLGDDAWDILRPDRPTPADRHAPGVPRASVVAVIDRLESL